MSVREIAFENFKIYLGDGGSPSEAFDAPCGFKEKALEITADVSEGVIPNCPESSTPGWKKRIVTALQAAVNGQGVADLNGYETWRTWALSGVAKNIRVEFNDTGANGGGYYAGAALLTNLGNSASIEGDAGMVQFSVQLQSTGAWTWTDAA